MNIEILLSTMHQKDASFIEKMNIKSDAIVINQTDSENYEEFKTKYGVIKIFTNTARGVAKSRNEALKNSSADISILADDDMFFIDNYTETVRTVFNEHHDADIIIFNLLENDNTLSRNNEHVSKIGIFNYMNYGAARITFRRNSIKNANISFKETFNGEPLPTCGEDTLFLRDALKKGLKIIAVPEVLAELKNTRDSTWFKGYTEKYFFDKGIILALAHPFLAFPFALFLVLKHNEYVESGLTKLKIIKEIFSGILFVKKGNQHKNQQGTRNY